MPTRNAARHVDGVAYPHHDPDLAGDACPYLHRHDPSDGSCRIGACVETHYTTCLGCDEQTIPIVCDSAPAYHDECDPDVDA